MKLTIARFTLELISPMHIGSGLPHPATDAPVVRDAFGDYRIPGSSLAGALRAATSETAWGAAGKENLASMIEVSDGFLVDFDGKTTLAKRLAGEKILFKALPELQDHVRIDHHTGAAEEGGKFDAEVIPQGTRFRCELVLVERRGTPDGRLRAARDSFSNALRLLHSGDLALGGDVSSGLGLVHIVDKSLTIGTHDLATLQGITAARNRSASIDDPAGAVPATNDSAKNAQASPSAPAGISGKVVLRFRSDGPLLVGGSQRPTAKATGDKNHGADLVFGESVVADYTRRALVAKPWIPGSSLRGAIRHRTWQVLEALGRTEDDTKRCVDDLFGSIDGDAGRASKVRVRGCFLNDEPRTAVQHVAIDRLTGGSLRGALYCEAPIWKDGLTIDLAITLHGIGDDQAAALAHALIDMAHGELPIGGGTRRGNGRLLLADANGPESWQGKSVAFTLHRGNQIITNNSSSADIGELIDQLEHANKALAGANP
jgi:CRISPR/Cas system CMR subunit Cmr4 (Cas7 group RAMP superfamily)